MLCGYTVAEYIRYRRLALAGSELVSTSHKIIDIALTYGYDSPDAFTKAFTRFHGVTPTAVRKSGAMLKSFAPLKIKLTLEGGYSMNYKIVEKDAFTVMGVSKIFKYENAKQDVPVFWKDFLADENNRVICGQYGINIDESMAGNEFEYWIASDFNPAANALPGVATKVIPKFTWAVFECVGSMPQAMQTVNQKIYSEWLPSCQDYEIAAGYCVEMYSAPSSYANGTLDDTYYSEIWIPVKRK